MTASAGPIPEGLPAHPLSRRGAFDRRRCLTRWPSRLPRRRRRGPGGAGCSRGGGSGIRGGRDRRPRTAGPRWTDRPTARGRTNRRFLSAPCPGGRGWRRSRVRVAGLRRGPATAGPGSLRGGRGGDSCSATSWTTTPPLPSCVVPARHAADLTPDWPQPARPEAPTAAAALHPSRAGADDPRSAGSPSAPCGYSPVDCVAGAEVFADVPATSPFCRWVEEYQRRGITAGCTATHYCPTNGVTRGQITR